MYYKIDFDSINSKLIGYTDITQYWHLDKRSINEYELIFVEYGSIEIAMNNSIYLLEAGDCLFIEPEVMHEGKAIENGKFYYVHIECRVNCVSKNDLEDTLNGVNDKLKKILMIIAFTYCPIDLI